MSRYIDADELLKIKFKNPIGLTAFQNIVKRQPTADVRENVRGEWITITDVDIKMMGMQIKEVHYKCSICGGENEYDTNFCPKCGADKRGGDAE